MQLLAIALFSTLLNQEAEPMCFASDAKAMCCPSACAVKAKRGPTEADKVFGACWASLECKELAPSVFIGCGCTK